MCSVPRVEQSRDALANGFKLETRRAAAKGRIDMFVDMFAKGRIDMFAIIGGTRRRRE